MEKYNNILHMVFIDLEKSYGSILSVLEKKGVTLKYIKVIKMTEL